MDDLRHDSRIVYSDLFSGAWRRILERSRVKGLSRKAARAERIAERIGVTWMALTFPRQIRGWDLRRNVVNFIGQDAEASIACAISMEALIDNFGARDNSKQACLAAFDRWRTAIEQKASDTHTAQATNATILLRKVDFG
jgi:hypothetical protein